MLKKSGAILLTLLYLVTAMGFDLNMHYCGSHIVSVKINAPAKSCNIKVACKMKCCQNKHIEIKVKDTHQGISPTFLNRVFAFQMPHLIFASFFFNTQQTLFWSPIAKGPPDLLTNARVTFIKNHIFRI